MELSERETRRGLCASRVVTVACWTIIGAALWMMAGCSQKSKNHREVGFRWGTEFVFIDRTAKTSGADPNDAYESNVEFPALVEYFVPTEKSDGDDTAQPNPNP